MIFLKYGCIYVQSNYKSQQIPFDKGSIGVFPPLLIYLCLLKLKVPANIFGMNDILAWFLHCSYFYELRYNGVYILTF